MSAARVPQSEPVVPRSDEGLAILAQQGCAASFEELARRFQVPLLRFLQRWASKDDAEDLVQDTLLRAYENLHRYRPSWRFATWLFTIARRLSMNQRRRKQPTTDCEALEVTADQTPQPGQIVAERESRQHLWTIAQEVLSEQQLTATWLYYVEDMPVKQIARVLGRSTAVAKIELFRARKKLMPALQEMDTTGAVKEDGPPSRQRLSGT